MLYDIFLLLLLFLILLYQLNRYRRILHFQTCLYCLIQREHLIIQLGHHLRTLLQLTTDIIRCVTFKLIIDLVLKTYQKSIAMVRI